MPRLYRAYGLHLQSSLVIPGAVSVDVPAEPDLVIEEGRITDVEADQECGPYRRMGETLLFTMPGVARYLCGDKGTRLTVERLPQASPEDVAAMLIATALPAMLWMRGEIVLHAAAAVLPGHTTAIAFAGASGSGKSTILRSLLAAGARAVGDDTLCLRLRDGFVEASGLPACTFLYRPGFSGAERLEVAVAEDRQVARARLGALLVIAPANSREDLQPQPPVKLHAVQALLAHRHRPRVPRLLGLEGVLFPRLATLAHSFPICHCPAGSPDSAEFAQNLLLALRNMHGYPR